MSASEMAQLLPFLHSPHPSAQAIAATQLSPLSLTPEAILFNDEFVIQDLCALSEVEDLEVAHPAMTILINISASHLWAKTKIATPLFMLQLAGLIMRSSAVSQLACMLLSNLTKLPTASNALLDIRAKGSDETLIGALMKVFLNVNSNGEKSEEGKHFLASVFADISSTERGRQYFVSSSPWPIRSIVPFTEHESLMRRGGAILLIKNCCFVKDAHVALLSEDKEDVLPYILLPLCGPEEFDLEDQDDLPAACQLLPKDKKREPDAALRKVLVEALILLASSLRGRKIMRKRGVYTVIKEMHKVEKVDEVAYEAHRLVNLLMRDEGEDTLAEGAEEVVSPKKSQDNKITVIEEDEDTMLEVL